MGNGAEARFKQMIGEYRQATKQEDCMEHFDVEMANGDKVDIKARKRIGRGDASAQDELVWVEIHGTGKFSEGWCFGGKAKYIAFEVSDGFHLADREKLCEFVRSKVDFDSTPVLRAADALYRVYTRRDHDKLTLVRLRDVLEAGVVTLTLQEKFAEPCTLCGHKRAFTEVEKGAASPVASVAAPTEASSEKASDDGMESDVAELTP